jgi:hypothetical protein
MIREFEDAVLMIDLPEHGLKAGDLGTVVDIDKTGQQAILEFFSLDGKTLAVVPVLMSDIRPVSSKEIAHARSIE